MSGKARFSLTTGSGRMIKKQENQDAAVAEDWADKIQTER